MEGIRVRRSYQEMAKKFGVVWEGRIYDQDDWFRASDVNRALSAANACLYGVCHAALVSAGYHAGLGFIHTGKMLSFVYDVADLYKTETTVPLAFRACRAGAQGTGTAGADAVSQSFSSSPLDGTTITRYRGGARCL